MSAVNGQPTTKVLTYLSLFEQVQRKRLRYVNRVIIPLACVISFLLKAPYKDARGSLLLWLFQMPCLCISFILIKLCRNLNYKIEYLRAKSVFQQVKDSIASRNFLITTTYFTVSAILFYGTFLCQLPLLLEYYVLSKEFRKKPVVNDQWIYFWFHGIFCAIVYSCQHLIFQRNRLRFKFGVSYVKPQTVVFTNLPRIFFTTILITVYVSFTSPIIYAWARPLIYKLNWIVFFVISLDTNIPPLEIGFQNYFSVSFAGFLLCLSWEIVNHVYAIYASIGCLDGKTLICSKSLNPLETLILGLRDVTPQNQLSRVTAFQELAYISSNDNLACVGLRKSLFATSRNRTSLWSAILDECTLLINEASLRINYRTKADLDALKSLGEIDSQNPGDKKTNQERIFGNSEVVQPLEKQALRSEGPISEKSKDSIPTIVLKPNKGFWTLKVFELIKKYIWNFIYSPSESSSVHLNIQALRDWIHSQEQHFLSSNFGLPFRINLKQDAMSRMLEPIKCGNAIIALSGILLHAVEEDRYNTVTDQSISEVFNLLERPIRSCTNYINVPPASVFLTEAQKKSPENRNHLFIALLHDLAMREFINLCIKYNYKLNDLLLTPKAFKLAKWVIDASIAQQLQQNQSRAANLL